MGVPVAASTVIVSRGTLRPQPRGVEGEIAISGPTVLKRYLDNPEADAKSFFLLTTSPRNGGEAQRIRRYFLTGDVGVIDGDGFLSLKGRAKELIKKGGEQGTFNSYSALQMHPLLTQRALRLVCRFILSIRQLTSVLLQFFLDNNQPPVSPFEVEEPLLNHPWVQTPVCFAVPSALYGEEVGCALVLSSDAPEGVEEGAIVKEMRRWLRDAKLAPIKWPTKWVVCTDDQLPKTKTKKYVRIGLAETLGLLDDEEDSAECPIKKKETKAKIDWEVITGFRFCLACYVMFMHIGSNESWGRFNNLRGFPWHVHVFFTLGGFSLASPMNPTILKKFSYFTARILQMYPLYALALVFGLANLLVVCRPSTFRPTFHWHAQPDDLVLEDGSTAPLFCEGTPATPGSYWASLFLTIVTYVFGLAVTPFWPISWWLGYYLWFSSMYYQCLAIFPATYNFFFDKLRKKTTTLLSLLIGLLVLNAAIIAGAWFTLRDYSSSEYTERSLTNVFDHYDDEGAFDVVISEEAVPPDDEYNDTDVISNSAAVNVNVYVLSYYLFGPFWALYFIIGVCTAFLYDAYRPAERHRAHVWGWVADGITLVMIGLSISMVLQERRHGEERFFLLRPDEADDDSDNASVHRLWDNSVGRIMAPLTTLWVFSMSTGYGRTAAFLRTPFLVETLGPNSYSCFLFHQVVGQWYYAATRSGHMWNWWRYRKRFYWFSPGPCPVEWYEYIYVVGLVVAFSRFLDHSLLPWMNVAWARAKELILRDGGNGEDEDDEEDIGEVLCKIIEKMTGIEPEHDSTLEECGLASVGIPVLVSLLNKAFSKKDKPLGITAAHLIGAKTIADMVEQVEAVRDLAEDQGV